MSLLKLASRGLASRLGTRAISSSAASRVAEPAVAVDELVSNVPTQLLIDGKFVDPVAGRRFDVLNPATEQRLVQMAEADKEDVERAVRAARKAFDEGPWPRMGGKARGKILQRFAELVEKNVEELAQLESLDNGKPIFFSRNADIPLTANHLSYFAGWADKIHGQTIPCDNTFGNFFAYTLHEPIGVVGSIIPWNFPALMAAWKIAPALAAGNCVVLKPAEQTPLTAMRLGQLALEAGLPPGVLNVVPGFGPSAGGAIVRSPLVDKVSFTGSTEVGKIIMKEAAATVKPVGLELGGKSPLIVWKDVDVDKAVEDAHFALFFNHGQCCVAGSRLFVHEAIYDEFVEKAAARAKSKKVGDPFTDVEQGPQVDRDQMDKILGYIESGKQQGAKLLAGGSRMGDRGYFVQPTVFADVQDDMKIAQEEIFGPVQSILKFSSLEEVAQRANNNPYGLGAGVFARDVDVINYLTRSIRAGTVWVNCYNVFDDSVPFGGYKQSGIGRDKGEAALAHYTQVKSVYQKMETPQPWL
ncbi:hypothetical protein ABPG75_012753 [Micractinium tetrahymenae]